MYINLKAKVSLVLVGFFFFLLVLYFSQHSSPMMKILET